jgi:hypothetical protein
VTECPPTVSAARDASIAFLMLMIVTSHEDGTIAALCEAQSRRWKLKRLAAALN